MKPLHLIAGKDAQRPHLSIITVQNGFVYVTNGSALIKMPAKEVFGEKVITDDEILIFDAAMWSLLKFHTAKLIAREGLLFKNLTSGTEMLAKTPKDFGFKIPDYDRVLPENEKPVVPVTWQSFDPSILIDLVKAFGTKGFQEFKFQFYGNEKCIEVLHVDFPTTSAILMPTKNMTEVKEYKAPELIPVQLQEEKPKPVEKRKTPVYGVSISSDTVIDKILDLFKEHTATRVAILDDYMLGDEGCRMELAVADDNLRDELAEMEVEDSYGQLLQKLKDHDEYVSSDLIEDTGGDIFLQESLQSRGYAIIKIDNILQQSKLEDFVKAEIWPLYSDQDKYSI